MKSAKSINYQYLGDATSVVAQDALDPVDLHLVPIAVGLALGIRGGMTGFLPVALSLLGLVVDLLVGVVVQHEGLVIDVGVVVQA